MRRLILAACCLLALLGSVGCALPIYSGDPAIRTRQLIYTSEDLRQFRQEWSASGSWISRAIFRQCEFMAA